MKTVLEPCRAVSSEGGLDRSDDTVAWFCLRTQSKHEHIAAAQLRQDPGTDVFLPRIRYKRSTRVGLAWVTEALFRNYIFARFDLALSLRRVQHARGVQSVVHFGDRWPVIPNHVIEELRAQMGSQEVHVIDETLQPGDPVQLVGGAMNGLRAIVTRIIPAKERVAVLLDFLGRQTSLELDRGQVISEFEDRFVARLSMWPTHSSGLPQSN